MTTGEYAFHCTIHPDTMTGTLEVLDAGAPVPRPEISLKVKSKKLGKVVKSGKLKVRVSAGEPTLAENIKLKGRKGKKAVTKAKKLNLPAAAPRR